MFLTKSNVSTIWDVISDEDIVKSQDNSNKNKIFQLFSENVKGFYDNEKLKNTNLIDMNKKYILLIMNYINNNFTKINKIKIYEEIPKEKNLITYEEIQSDRKTQFEKDLSKRQEEFTNAMTIKAPPIPVFTDNMKDSPISEMEKEIQLMTSKRNYEIEQINKNINNANVENWLKSQDTSIKSEKYSQSIQEDININNNKLKYLKIDDNNINNINNNIDLNFSPKKVNWGENETREFESNELEEYNFNENNIFSKLKKVDTLDYSNKELVRQSSSDDKIEKLQKEVKNINEKLEMILELIKNKI